MTKNLYTVLLCTSLLYVVPAHAEIFKWIDANGMTHYTDKAPKKRASKSLRVGQVKKKSVSKQQVRVVKKPTASAKQYQTPKTFYNLELIGKKVSKFETTPVFVPNIKLVMPRENKPDLDAVEYDLRTPPKVARQQIRNVKQKFCTE